MEQLKLLPHRGLILIQYTLYSELATGDCRIISELFWPEVRQGELIDGNPAIEQQ